MDLNKKRLADIQAALTAAFHPTHLSVTDDSHLHRGHAGAQTGAGHFTVTIASMAFKDKRLLACHQLIYQALDTLLGKDIHALRIQILR